MLNITLKILLELRLLEGPARLNTWTLAIPSWFIVVVSCISDRIQQCCRNRKTFCKYKYSQDIETLLYCAGGHQGSRKAHQADNQKTCNKLKGENGGMGLNYFLKLQRNINTNGYLLWHINAQQSAYCRVHIHCALDISRSYFFKDCTKRHPIARDMGCCVCIQSLVEVISLYLLFYV